MAVASCTTTLKHNLTNKSTYFDAAPNGDTIATNVNCLNEFYIVHHQNCQRLGIKSTPRKLLEKIIKTCRENLFVLYAYLSSGELGAVALFIVTVIRYGIK